MCCLPVLNNGFILSVDGNRYETTQGKTVAQIHFALLSIRPRKVNSSDRLRL